MPSLQVGCAVADITPPVGVAMAGYGRDHGAEAIETPLNVCALVVDDGETCAAMAFTDLIGVTPNIVRRVREAVSGQTPIPADAVMVGASHTHWGPALDHTDYLPPHLQQCVLPEYLDSLAQTIAGALIEAWEERGPACAGWGIGVADGISFNRRPVSTDGKTVMSFQLPPEQAMAAAAAGWQMRQAWRKGGDKGPRLSPALEALDGLQAGVTDPEVVLLKLETTAGTPLCGLANFACHPVVGGENFYAISPDYPGEARPAFEAVVGGPLVFALGCAGDQVPAWRGGNSRVRVGRSLGAAASRAWYQIEHCTAAAPLATTHRKISLALKDLPSIEEAQAALAACDDPDSPEAGAQRHQLAMAEMYEGQDDIHTELWGVRIGDWAAVGLPGELFAEIGLQIKQQSPFPVTAVISLCNDALNYIATRQAHGEGGYEPGWSHLGPAAERQVVDAAVSLLHSLS